MAISRTTRAAVLAGIVAGLLTFAFARVAGEPLVDTAISFEEKMQAAHDVIEAESDLVNDNGCDATTPLTPPTSGDDAARLTYSFGSVAGHQSKTVVVRYQRM